MDELHCDRAFADAGSHAFDGTMSHIANRENTRDICLKQERVAVQGPTLGLLPVANEIGTSQQETAVVSFDQVSQPLGARLSSDKNKHRTCRNPLNLICVRTQNGDLFQMRGPMHFLYAGMRPQLDVGHFLDL